MRGQGKAKIRFRPLNFIAKRVKSQVTRKKLSVSTNNSIFLLFKLAVAN